MTHPSAFFISDAHLGVHRKGCDGRERHLLRFLDGISGKASHLFIVGDLFDFWFEYGNLIRADYFDVLSALRNVQRAGAEVHYVAGNHDFALGPFLEHRMGFVIHQFAFDGELQGKRIRVQHGDGLLKQDIGYGLLRTVLRSRVNQSLYRLLHPAIGLWLASAVSRTSRHFSAGVLPQWALIGYRDAARKLLADSGAQIVVLGHTHTAEMLCGAQGVYCNTGEWMRRCTFARMSGGELTLLRYAEDGTEELIPAQAW